MDLIDRYNTIRSYVQEEQSGIKFRPVDIWTIFAKQKLGAPDIHNTQKIFFKDDNIEVIMGKLLNLFEEPNNAGDGYKISRRYEIEAILLCGKRLYFTIYDWKEYSVHIGFEHSLIDNVDQERLVEEAIVRLIDNHSELTDFAESFNYDRGGYYGVKDGEPFREDSLEPF